MASILLQHADLITLDASGDVLRNADVAIRDGIIAAIGTPPSDFSPDETLDATNHIVMPGFFNAHTRTPMTLLRGWGENHAPTHWADERVWASELGQNTEDVYWGAALAAAEMIRSGTVGFGDRYFYMDEVARVAVESGLRANLAWCTFGDERGEIGADLSGVADFVERWQGAGGGRIRTLLGPHSPHRCSPQFLARTAAVAARLGVGIHIQVAETLEQVSQSLAQHDLTPVELLNTNGVLDVPVVAVHCVHLSEADVEILAARDVTVVYCPSAQMKLGLGTTPVSILQEHGVRVALGTDGPPGCGALDVLQEARLAVLVGRFEHRSPEVISGDTALRMATQVGARALGFHLSGELAAGRAADLVMFRGNSPRLCPRHDLVANILYSAGSTDISDVMVAGRWLMRDGALLTLDEERILREAERRAFRLVSHNSQPLGRLQ